MHDVLYMYNVYIKRDYIILYYMHDIYIKWEKFIHDTYKIICIMCI